MQTLERGMSSTHILPEGYEIRFSKDESDALSVTIDTQHLHLRSVNSEDSGLYFHLFNDHPSTERVQSADAFVEIDKVRRIVNQWSAAWEENDPYSSLAIFRKEDNEFIGNINLGHGDEPGHSKLSCRFMSIHQGKGYGQEAVTAVINGFVPATIKEGYMLDGKPLGKITTIVHDSNSDIISFFRNLGMERVEAANKYGPNYSLYSLKV